MKPTEARPEQQEDIKVPGFDSETFEDERPANMEQTIHDLPNHHKKEYIAHIQHQPLIADDVSNITFKIQPCMLYYQVECNLAQ